MSKIQHDVKQVINDTKNKMFDTLNINNTKNPYQICNIIKSKYNLTVNQSVSFFMGRTINLVGCSPVDTTKKIGCLFQIKLNEKEQVLNYNGQLCQY